MNLSIFFNDKFLKISFGCIALFLCFHISLFSADVDTSLRLSTQEEAFIEKRENFAHEKILNRVSTVFEYGFDPAINKLPRIAFCFSGGGNRALITSLGFMLGMQECGLLDCASYSSFLSGSSWFFITYLLKNTNLLGYKDFMRERLSKPFNKSFYEFLCDLGKVSKSRGYSSISDGYGSSIYKYLLGDTVAEDASFSEIRKRIQSDGGYQMPFPLFTAVVKNGYPYRWLEVNPFLAGSDELGGYIKTELWGSCFENGVCTKVLPELSLSSFMGIFGSAYCVNKSDFERFGGLENLRSLPFYRYLESSLGMVISTESVLFSIMDKFESKSMFENFSYKTTLPNSDIRRFVVADAGLDFNLPVPPLLKKERGVDIIFICDSTAYTSQDDEQSQFELITAYASRNGLNIPSLTKPVNIGDNVWIFESDNENTPTIVYFKLSTAFGTLKFEYTGDEFDLICDSVKNTVINSQGAINLAINKKTTLLNKGKIRRSWFRRILSFLSI